MKSYERLGIHDGMESEGNEFDSKHKYSTRIAAFKAVIMGGVQLE